MDIPLELLYIDTVDADGFYNALGVSAEKRVRCQDLLFTLFMNSCMGAAQPQQFQSNGDDACGVFGASAGKGGGCIEVARQIQAGLPNLADDTAKLLGVSPSLARRPLLILAHVVLVRSTEDLKLDGSDGVLPDPQSIRTALMGLPPNRIFVTEQLLAQACAADRSCFVLEKKAVAVGALRTDIYRER